MSTFPLRIVTPSGEAYAGAIEYLSVNTPDGREGFLRGALPRVVLLADGRIEIKTEVIELEAQVGGGIVCVEADGVTVLTDSCVFADDNEAPPTEQNRGGDVGYKKAKARIVSSIKRMNDKTDRGTFD